MFARKTVLMLSAVCCFVLSACNHHYDKKPRPVPLSSAERARLDELRALVADPMREIAAVIANNPNIEPIDRLGGVALCFTGNPDNPTIHAAASSDITFPDDFVLGDGNGCALDPPGISCECPCPE